MAAAVSDSRGKARQRGRFRVYCHQEIAPRDAAKDAGKLCGGEGRIEVKTGIVGKLRLIDDWRFIINSEGGGQALCQEL